MICHVLLSNVRVRKMWAMNDESFDEDAEMKAQGGL